MATKMPMGGSSSYSVQDFYIAPRHSMNQSAQNYLQAKEQAWQEAILKAEQANQVTAQADAMSSQASLQSQLANNFGNPLPKGSFSTQPTPPMPGGGWAPGGVTVSPVPGWGGGALPGASAGGGAAVGGAGYYDPWGQFRDDAASQLGGTLGQGSPSDIYKNKLAQMVSGQFSPDDPSYQWRFQQGQQAAERSLASRGLLNSGNAAIELQQYGQGAASQEYGAQFNRLLQGLSGVEDTYNTQMGRLMSMAGVNQNPVAVGELGVKQGQLGLQGQELANQWALGNRELDIKQQLAAQSAMSGMVGGMSGSNWASIFGPTGAVG